MVLSLLPCASCGETPASEAAVRAGCDGVCWFEDAGVLVLSVRRTTPTTVTIR